MRMRQQEAELSSTTTPLDGYTSQVQEIPAGVPDPSADARRHPDQAASERHSADPSAVAE